MVIAIGFLAAQLQTAIGSLQFPLLCGCSVPSDKPDGSEVHTYIALRLKCGIMQV
jgi:hypothetical protein